jgi:hypothetical protein
MEPLTRGLPCPHIPVLSAIYLQLNLLNHPAKKNTGVTPPLPPPEKIPGYATEVQYSVMAYRTSNQA